MRKAVEESITEYDGNIITHTASFGVYTIKPNKENDVLSFIESADKSLYTAKNNGRNRVEA